MPGSLTLKKEPVTKRDNSKRKIVAVPELLPERVELTKQPNEIELEPMQIYLDSDGIEQESTEMLEVIHQPIEKDELVEIVPQTTAATAGRTSGHIEILEQRLINSPLSNALSYSIPKTSVLVLTTDGNYVITKLDDDVSKTDEIQVSPPQVKEIIILNGNDLQLADVGMGIDYQTIQLEREQMIDDDDNNR